MFVHEEIDDRCCSDGTSVVHEVAGDTGLYSLFLFKNKVVLHIKLSAAPVIIFFLIL